MKVGITILRGSEQKAEGSILGQTMAYEVPTPMRNWELGFRISDQKKHSPTEEAPGFLSRTHVKEGVNVKANATLDAIGLYCPMPIYHTAKKMKELKAEGCVAGAVAGAVARSCEVRSKAKRSKTKQSRSA